MHLLQYLRCQHGAGPHTPIMQQVAAMQTAFLETPP
jgi:hypothetical protein